MPKKPDKAREMNASRTWLESLASDASQADEETAAAIYRAGSVVSDHLWALAEIIARGRLD